MEPLRNAGLPVPQLKFLNSPYRFIIYPIVDYILRLEEENPGREIAVIIPELGDEFCRPASRVFARGLDIGSAQGCLEDPGQPLVR